MMASLREQWLSPKTVGWILGLACLAAALWMGVASPETFVEWFKALRDCP